MKWKFYDIKWNIQDLGTGTQSIANLTNARYANCAFRSVAGDPIFGRASLQPFKITESRVQGQYV
ncbi:hypothetical protein BD410DRAFT_793512 [Rickenella mellea]|uniref:Uncharacterized protein n=1 Tax=Rickenella mellea TaxID=50990 RepID=A0A4Y7PUI8_9AGAM|nr:hypothetical protein BD410DRAFT_793512 [Rickenella mellea]